jgi:hypothetical protein
MKLLPGKVGDAGAAAPRRFGWPRSIWVPTIAAF